MTDEIFTKEYIREMNYKASLIRKAEALRKSDNLKYSKLVDTYGGEYRRLYVLSIERLKELVSELSKQTKPNQTI